MQNATEILSGQCGLAGVQDLLTGAAAQTMLRNLLGGLLERPEVLGDCRLQRAKFKPGRKLTAYYDLQLHEQGSISAGIRPIAVTWTMPGAKQTVDGTAFEATVVQNGLAAPFQKLTASAPDWGMRLQVSPLDPRFPQLVRLSDPCYVRDRLAAETKSVANDYTISVIRYRPNQRHVLRYHLLVDATSTQGKGTIFAKLYPPATSHRHFEPIADQIADWLVTCTSAVTALRPQAIWPEENTIIYPWVNGAPLSHYVGQPVQADYLAQTGSSLRAMHAAPASITQDLPAHTLAAQIKAIAQTCEHIQILLPTVGQKISNLLQRASALYTKLPQEAPTFIHGDFKADHVLVGPQQDSNPRLTLIDFDSCAQADPAFDIGKFLADLDWTYAQSGQAGLVEAQKDFLAGYNLEADAPRLLRARIVEALILVKITAHRVPIFKRNWAERTSAMIEQAVTVLERIGNN